MPPQSEMNPQRSVKEVCHRNRKNCMIAEEINRDPKGPFTLGRMGGWSGIMHQRLWPLGSKGLSSRYYARKPLLTELICKGAQAG